eukprot:3066913-Rhodomonas_salina.5
MRVRKSEGNFGWLYPGYGRLWPPWIRCYADTIRCTTEDTTHSTKFLYRATNVNSRLGFHLLERYQRLFNNFGILHVICSALQDILITIALIP